MDISVQITRLKRRLGIDGTDNDNVLFDLFDNCLGVALSVCNIDSADTIPAHKQAAICSIVGEAAASLYNQRGNEGSTGFSTGGQGASYTDVYDSMRQKLIKSGCRIWR